MVIIRRRYLERWNMRARRRRQRLQRILERSVHPLGPVRRRNWLRRFRVNLATRRAWLEARLAHLHALEQLANSAANRCEPATQAGKQAAASSPNYQVLRPAVRPAGRAVPPLRKIAPTAKVTAKPVAVGSAPAHVPSGTAVPRQAPGKRRKQK
jgi:hypothetical protein